MRSIASASFAAILLVLPGLAVAGVPSSARDARPQVSLTLSGTVIATSADGRRTTTPVERVVLKAGDQIAYDIAATNVGGVPAQHLIPVGRIPNGTAYVGGSAKAPHARVEFSLDGGKTWAATPMVKVKLPDGSTVVRKADPATYTTIRFVASGALRAHEGTVYTYEVRVK